MASTLKAGLGAGVILVAASLVLVPAGYIVWGAFTDDDGLTFAHLTPGIVALGVGISLGLGIVTGALAALRLVKVQPLVLFRRA